MNARTKHREPAIHNARVRGHEELAALLVEYGVKAKDVAPISSELASVDLEQGKIHVKLECTSCHSLEPGKTMVGPSLWDLVGREKASVSKFP